MRRRLRRVGLRFPDRPQANRAYHAAMMANPPGTWASRWPAGLLLGVAVAIMLPACAAGGPAEPDGWAADAGSRLTREWDRATDAPPEFRARLAESPLAFFRFVNRAWTHAVCDAFTGEAPDLPPVRLHGDAHIEQYAVTATARGLDDFDDSARGPVVVDIVRFLGSLELAAKQREWTASLPAAVDAFFAAYRHALESPAVSASGSRRGPAAARGAGQVSRRVPVVGRLADAAPRRRRPRAAGGRLERGRGIHRSCGSRSSRRPS